MESMDLPSREEGAAGFVAGFCPASASERIRTAKRTFTRGSVQSVSAKADDSRARRARQREAQRSWLVPGRREFSAAAAGLVTSQDAVTYMTKHSTANGRNPRYPGAGISKIFHC